MLVFSSYLPKLQFISRLVQNHTLTKAIRPTSQTPSRSAAMPDPIFTPDSFYVGSDQSTCSVTAPCPPLANVIFNLNRSRGGGPYETHAHVSKSPANPHPPFTEKLTERYSLPLAHWSPS